jgi:HSP20 family molecular chaperone IbpA
MYNSDLNRLFDSIFNSSGYQPHWKTSVIRTTNEDESYEINHTKDGAYLFFDAPGFNKNNLKVEMEDGIISIEGKRTYKLNGEEVSKTISKKFNLDSTYNADIVEATIEDGLLTVFIPNYKKQEKKRISLL